jgi:DNA-binding MarR family transcriptional regulator
MEARCLIGVFRDISKELDKQVKKRIKEEQLPILSTHIPLFYILPETCETMAFNELSSEWDISKSSLSDIIKRYEELDLIYRMDSEVDKRVIQIGMKDKGLEIKRKLIEIEDELLEELMVDLTSKEKDSLEKMLRKLK